MPNPSPEELRRQKHAAYDRVLASPVAEELERWVNEERALGTHPSAIVFVAWCVAAQTVGSIMFQMLHPDSYDDAVEQAGQTARSLLRAYLKEGIPLNS